jgi:hypothetical protein
VAHLSLALLDRVGVDVSNHSGMRLRLVLCVPDEAVAPLGWVLPRATVQLVVTDEQLRAGVYLRALAPGGRLFEHVPARRLATGEVVLGDDRDGLAA